MRLEVRELAPAGCQSGLRAYGQGCLGRRCRSDDGSDLKNADAPAHGSRLTKRRFGCDKVDDLYRPALPNLRPKALHVRRLPAQSCRPWPSVWTHADVVENDMAGRRQKVAKLFIVVPPPLVAVIAIDKQKVEASRGVRAPLLTSGR